MQRYVSLVIMLIFLTSCSLYIDKNTNEPKGVTQVDKKEVNSILFYVPSEKENIISIIELPSNQVVGKIETGERPANVVFSHELGKAFVTHRNGDSIGVIDLKSLKMTNEIKVGRDPHALVLSNEELFVTTVEDQFVYVIDPRKETVSRKIDLGKGAKTNYPYLFEKRLYVTDHHNQTVYVVENDKLIDTYKVGGPPMVARTNKEGNLLYVASSSYKAIEVFDTLNGKKVNELKSGKGVTDFVISGDESLMIVTNKDENSVSIIDLSKEKIVKKIENLNAPKHISFNEDETQVYFTLSGTNKVAAINLETLELGEEIEVGRMPHGISLMNSH
jgi:DNA-binding beta-propeller fold protein YncE